MNDPNPEPPPPAPLRARSAAARALWTALGLGLVGLGAIGVVVPGLPTTPFLLLAAACFARGSARLEAWLLSSPTFGPLIADFREHRYVPRRIKVFALTLMWVFVAFALGPGMPAGRVLPRVVVALAAVIGTVYLMSLPSERGQRPGPDERRARALARRALRRSPAAGGPD